jgi:hypothetical protein
MTPKEKAQELVDKIYNYTVDVFILSTSLECSKQCALIAVDEIIEATIDDWSHSEYWQEVKREIENL